jgi:hypothetical protein
MYSMAAPAAVVSTAAAAPAAAPPVSVGGPGTISGHATRLSFERLLLRPSCNSQLGTGFV